MDTKHWKATLKLRDGFLLLLFSQSCLIFCDLMDCSMSSFPVFYHLSELVQTHISIESLMPSNHLFLCHPRLLLSLIFPSIRVFSDESAPHIRWSKYWSFTFRISPSNEYWVLISFRIDWFGLLAVQRTPESLVQHHNL